MCHFQIRGGHTMTGIRRLHLTRQAMLMLSVACMPLAAADHDEDDGTIYDPGLLRKLRIFLTTGIEHLPPQQHAVVDSILSVAGFLMIPLMACLCARCIVSCCYGRHVAVY